MLVYRRFVGSLRSWFVSVFRRWLRLVLVLNGLGEMEFAYVLGSDRRVHGRHFDHGCHGSGGPFEVVGLAGLRFKPGTLVLFLPGLIQSRSRRHDGASVVHLGQAGDDHGSRRYLDERVFTVEKFGEMSVVNIKLVVCGGAGKSVFAVNTDNRSAVGGCRQYGTECEQKACK